MAKVLVLYYSSYGHVETMAGAVADGARSAGADVTVKRVPELVPDEVAKSSNYKLDQRKAFNGMALAIVQTTGQPDPITITATAEGLPPATCVVRSL